MEYDSTGFWDATIPMEQDSLTDSVSWVSGQNYGASKNNSVRDEHGHALRSTIVREMKARDRCGCFYFRRCGACICNNKLLTMLITLLLVMVTAAGAITFYFLKQSS